MRIDLDKIEPNFRNLTDVLFFTNRQDADYSDYANFYLTNKDMHHGYIVDIFEKSCNIFWHNSAELWKNRLRILYSLRDRKLIKNISNEIRKNFLFIIRNKIHVSSKYNTEYIQYIELCKLKCSKKENLLKEREYLFEIFSSISTDYGIKIISEFFPFLFKDLNDFANFVSKKLVKDNYAIRNLQLLKNIEEHGGNYDKEILINVGLSILKEKVNSFSRGQTLLALLADDAVFDGLARAYTHAFNNKIISLFKELHYADFEYKNYTNIKNALKLAPDTIEQVINLYSDKLCNRGIKYVKANTDRLVKLINTIEGADPKTLLIHLSNKNRSNYIKHIFVAFPHLKQLSAFI